MIGYAGRALACLLTAALFMLIGCRGDDARNVLGPIVADVTIQDTSATDPAVYLDRFSASNDLVTIDVRMRTASSVDFDAFNIELLFDPGHIRVSQVFATSTPFGSCGTLMSGCATGTGSPGCLPFCCANAVDANITGDLILGVSAPAGCTVTSAADQILTRLVFIAAATGSSRLAFVDAPGTGDCEVLMADPMTPNTLIDLNVPCRDGMAEFTSTR